MNKERELLSQALEELEIHGEKTTWGLIEEIRTYLSTHSDDAEEPVEFKFIPTGNEILRYHLVEDCIETKVAFAKYPVGSKFYPPKPAEPEAEYDLSQVIPLTHRKAKGIIQDKNFYITGFVLTQEDGDKCIVDMSAVRWLTGKEFFEMMHPPVVSPTAEPAARKPMTEEEIPYHGSHYYRAFLAGVRFAEKHHFGIGGDK